MQLTVRFHFHWNHATPVPQYIISVEHTTCCYKRFWAITIFYVKGGPTATELTILWFAFNQILFAMQSLVYLNSRTCAILDYPMRDSYHRSIKIAPRCVPLASRSGSWDRWKGCCSQLGIGSAEHWHYSTVSMKPLLAAAGAEQGFVFTNRHRLATDATVLARWRALSRSLFLLWRHLLRRQIVG